MSADFVAVTIGVGEEHRRLAEIAAAKMRLNTGLDTVILGDDEFRRCKLRDPNHLKFRIFDLVDAANVLYFDSDLFCLRPWDPRQFLRSLAWVAVRGFWFDERVEQLGRKFGFRDETFNGGFFIINRRKHHKVLQLAEKIQPADGLYDGFYSVDEMAFSVALRRLHVPIELLDRRYNWIQYGKGDLAADCDVVQAHACDAALRSQYYVGDELPASGNGIHSTNGAAVILEREIGGRVWHYERVGYDTRLMELRSDGTIGAGGGNAERYWYVSYSSDGEPQLVIGSVFDKTCVLDLRADGTWRGHWGIGERMPIRLRPTLRGTGIPREEEHRDQRHQRNGHVSEAAIRLGLLKPLSAGLAEPKPDADAQNPAVATNGLKPASRAIVTACDEPYFPGFQVLAHGLKGWPIFVFDLGLSERQRDWCHARGIELAEPPPEVVPRTIRGWQSWNKPFYLEASPYELSLWLDCDCVVVGSVAPLFEHVENQPLIMRHWDEVYANANKPELYEKRPVVGRFDSPRLLNAGVIGIRKGRDLDSAWYTHWCRIICDAARDAELRELISFWDEGALIWALQAAGQTNLATIRPEWDRFMFSDPIASPVKLWADVAKGGEDVIWHFAGVQKVWDNWRIVDSLLEDRSFEEPSPACALTPNPRAGERHEWTVDRRHIDWVYDLVISGRFATGLEIGSFNGAVSSAFIEAVNQRALGEAMFCDPNTQAGLFRMMSRCRYPERLRTYAGRSVDLLRKGSRYDFVFIDGNHGFSTVWEELELLLKSPPKCLMAHDTSSGAAGIPGCDGAAYLKWRLQTLPGYLCLEDNFLRTGERTERGLFLATTDREVFEMARESLAKRCPVVD